MIIMRRGMIQITHMKPSIEDDSEPILGRRRVCDSFLVVVVKIIHLPTTKLIR